MITKLFKNLIHVNIGVRREMRKGWEAVIDGRVTEQMLEEPG